MRKTIKNKRGFSLVELLIVIAILGIISALALLTLGGIMKGTYQKVDYKNAHLIERAVEAYIFLTEDTELKHLTYAINKDKDMNGVPSTELIFALQNTIISEKNGEELEPLLTPKDGNIPSADNFATQWEGHKGYKIEVYTENNTCDVFPVGDIDDAIVNVN